MGHPAIGEGLEPKSVWGSGKIIEKVREKREKREKGS
jgi:hypothetical protein